MPAYDHTAPDARWPVDDLCPRCGKRLHGRHIGGRICDAECGYWRPPPPPGNRLGIVGVTAYRHARQQLNRVVANLELELILYQGSSESLALRWGQERGVDVQQVAGHTRELVQACTHLVSFGPSVAVQIAKRSHKPVRVYRALPP